MSNRLPGTDANGIKHSYRHGRGQTIYRGCTKAEKIAARRARKR